MHFGTSFRECTWELYHLDCRKMAAIIMNHPMINRCSGFVLRHADFSCTVIELDLPWDNLQAEVYGDSFMAWSEDVFKEAILALITALPMKKHTVVVSCCVLVIFQVYHSLDQRRFVHTVLTKSYKLVMDFYLYKTGLFPLGSPPPPPSVFVHVTLQDFSLGLFNPDKISE